LSLEPVDVLEFSFEVRGGEGVLGVDTGEGVGSVVLQVVLVADFGLVGERHAVELDLGEAVQVVVAAIDAESALMVEELTRGLEVKSAVLAGGALATFLHCISILYVTSTDKKGSHPRNSLLIALKAFFTSV
jgi:hypothetical protein